MSFDKNSGYSGYSMSKRAAAAYQSGEMQKSKWTKQAILAEINALCDEEERVMVPEITKMTKVELFERFLMYTGWHHTSKFCNVTHFYGLDELSVHEESREMTAAEKSMRDAEIECRLAEERNRQEEARKRKEKGPETVPFSVQSSFFRFLWHTIYTEVLEMRKLCFIGLSFLMMISTAGCGSGKASSMVTNAAEKLSAADSASLTLRFGFEGTISNGNEESSYLIRVESGCTTKTEEQYFSEEWSCFTDMSLFGDTTHESFQYAGVRDGDTDYYSVISNKDSDGEWTTCDLTSFTSNNYLLSSIIGSTADHAEKDTESGEITSKLSSEALKELVSCALSPIGSYDLSSCSWEDMDVPITITLGDDGCPSSLTADCRTIGAQIAEAVSGKSGIRMEIDTCSVELHYDDINRISEVALPDILTDTSLF